MENKVLYRELGLWGLFLQLMDKYPILNNIVVLVEIIAVIWAIITYNFTTSI